MSSSSSPSNSSRAVVNPSVMNVESKHEPALSVTLTSTVKPNGAALALAEAKKSVAEKRLQAITSNLHRALTKVENDPKMQLAIISSVCERFCTGRKKDYSAEQAVIFNALKNLQLKGSGFILDPELHGTNGDVQSAIMTLCAGDIKYEARWSTPENIEPKLTDERWLMQMQDQQRPVDGNLFMLRNDPYENECTLLFAGIGALSKRQLIVRCSFLNAHFKDLPITHKRLMQFVPPTEEELAQDKAYLESGEHEKLMNQAEQAFMDESITPKLHSPNEQERKWAQKYIDDTIAETNASVERQGKQKRVLAETVMHMPAERVRLLKASLIREYECRAEREVLLRRQAADDVINEQSLAPGKTLPILSPHAYGDILSQAIAAYEAKLKQYDNERQTGQKRKPGRPSKYSTPAEALEAIKMSKEKNRRKMGQKPRKSKDNVKKAEEEVKSQERLALTLAKTDSDDEFDEQGDRLMSEEVENRETIVAEALADLKNN